MSLKKSQLRVVIPQLTSDSPNILGCEISLEADDSHRIRSVLRKVEGDELTLVSGSEGRSFLTVISKLSPRVVLKIIREEELKQARSTVTTLACALLKSDRNEWVCEKACELGVGRIILWQAQHSVVRLDEKSEENKKKRLERIVKDAARQSTNFTPPAIEFLKNAEDLVRNLQHVGNRQTLTIFCSLAPDATNINAVVDKEKQTQIIIGPEGDIASHEEQLFRDAGMLPVSLGPLILRAETAGIAAIVSVNTLCGFSSE